MAGKPVLIYDDGCAFCRLWVKRWQRATGDAVAYRAATEPLPAVTLELANGERYAGAKAVCRLFADVPGRRWLWRAYERMPLFAPLAELAYRVVSSCRECAYRFTTLVIRDE